jgi:hypothetical protein
MPGLSGRELAERARDFVSGCVFCWYRVESGGRVTEEPFSQSDLRQVMADTTGLCDGLIHQMKAENTLRRWKVGPVQEQKPIAAVAD